MRLQVLGVGIIILAVGGIFQAIGASQFFSRTCPIGIGATCNIGQLTEILILGSVVFFIGIIVTIIGAVLSVPPNLKESSGLNLKPGARDCR